MPTPTPTDTAAPCSLLSETAKAYCEGQASPPPPPASDACDGIWGQAREICERGVAQDQGAGPEGLPPGSGGLTDGASDHVKDLADWLLDAVQGLLAPSKTWAPETIDSVLYAPFLWLGQHLAVAVFTCVVVVCGLTAWQGVPRLRQMGHSTGWTMAAVVAMASVPGVVTLLHQAVSAALRRAFDGGEGTLFDVIRQDLETGQDAHPLGILIIVAALCVALGFALLVYAVRQPAILVLVCMAPLVMASLARGGDTTALKKWLQRLLGLLFAPFAMLLLLPFVPMVKGQLAMDAVLLVAADVLMLRMIVHGVPWIGPRVARATRAMVERTTDNKIVHQLVRAGVPDMHERETQPHTRIVDTPGRALGQDRSVLLGAYGIRQEARPGRLTTDSTADRVHADAARTARLTAARRAARTSRPAPAAGPAPAAPSSGSGAGVKAAPPAAPPRPTPPAAPNP